MASPNKPAKAMSSRLLTMKFMQRAAATSPPSTVGDKEGRPTKRPRLSEPSSSQVGSASLKDVNAALAAEDRKRTKALELLAAEAGDTKWSLNLEDHNGGTTAGFNVIHAGYSAIDSEETNENHTDEDLTRPVGMSGRGLVARKSFGNFNKALEGGYNQSENGSVPSTPGDKRGNDEDADSASSDGESEVEGVEANSETSENMNSGNWESTGGKTKESKKSKRRAEKQDSSQKAERRRNKEMKLSSISDRGSGAKSSPLSSGSGGCFKCGSLEHQKRDCPKGRTGGGSRGGYGRGKPGEKRYLG